MKNWFTLLLLALIGSMPAMAQNRSTAPSLSNKRAIQPVKIDLRQPVGAQETGPFTQSPYVPKADNVLAETVLGTTTYDLQSNGSLAKRFHNWGGGVVSGVWQLSTGTEANGFPDRGTGYNKSDAQGTFPTPPTTRIDTVRTGFPTYVVTGSGEEWVFAHGGTAGMTNRIAFAHKSANATTWTKGFLPRNNSAGHLWARAAVGGSNNNTLHVIALTTPVASGGTLSNGLDGQLSYWRSTNGGTTWDIIDQPLAGIDTSNFVGVDADAYAIDANGNTVAVLIQSLLSDAVVVKSTDNGTTWAAARTVNDFPIPKFSLKNSYTFEDISQFYDPEIYPDSLSILTTDGTGNLLIDNQGVVHVAAPTLFVLDTDTSDLSYNYYPGYNLGILYWNDNWADNQGIIAAYSPDLNADSTWGNANSEIYAEGYGEGFSTGPSLGMDAAGDLYMVFISNHELLQDPVTFEHNRQPFISRASSAGGYTNWGEPIEVLQDDLVFDPALVELSEYYFAQIAENVDDKAHIFWQKDFTKGLTLRVTGSQDPEENYIEYLGFPVNRVTTSAKDVVLNSLDFKVMPNPVTTSAQIFFDLTQSGETRIELLNLNGAVVSRQQMGLLNAGMQLARINTADLPAGIYFVRLQSGNEMGIKKIAVNR